jgi:hypothetical protein
MRAGHKLQALLAARVFAAKLFVADAVVFGFQLIALGAALGFQFFLAHGFFAGLAFHTPEYSDWVLPPHNSAMVD